MKKMPNIKLDISFNAPIGCPVAIACVVFSTEGIDASFSLNKGMIDCNEWGIPSSIRMLNGGNSPEVYHCLELVWISTLEKKCFSIRKDFPVKKMEELIVLMDRKSTKQVYDQILVGMAPYGRLALWLYGIKKSTVVAWFEAQETSINMSDFMPMTPNVTLEEFCKSHINENQEEDTGLPSHDLFDRYMQQFNYRYMVEFGHWDEEKKEWKDYEGDEVRPEFDYIEEALYDGTHDKLHDGGLMQYHTAGKPKKLALQYHITKSDYSAYLWFEDLIIRATFESFYREYPETQMDFLFRIDPEKNIYQILFTCKEAEQPMPLNEDAFQMIVFKSKFERYRTKNYNQPRGAWIW